MVVSHETTLLIEEILDGIYILAITALIVNFAKGGREERLRILVVLPILLLAPPFFVVNYTIFRPTFMMTVWDTVIKILETNEIFSNLSTKLSQGNMLYLLIDSPFNNPLIDILYIIGMLFYAIVITLAMMVTSAISSLFQAIWKLLTRK
ncbi:MAG: hypothetical protein ACPLSP_01740 [Fervidicoccus fontis]